MTNKDYRKIELIDHPKDYEFDIGPYSDEQLKQIAQDLWAGKIFSNLHIRDWAGDAFMVFMPLVFMNQFQLDDMKKKEVNFIYEYISNATPTAVNGMPTFFSMRMLTKPDTKRMMKYYEAIKEAMAKLELPKEDKDEI